MKTALPSIKGARALIRSSRVAQLVATWQVRMTRPLPPWAGGSGAGDPAGGPGGAEDNPPVIGSPRAPIEAGWRDARAAAGATVTTAVDNRLDEIQPLRSGPGRYGSAHGLKQVRPCPGFTG